jgi:cytochrome c-type biogenesis protein CcmH
MNRDIPIIKHKILHISLTLLILLVSDLSVAVQYHNEEALQKKAREIYELIMCPLCAGQTIAQSGNETSSQMRDLVLKKLRQGETKEQILQYFESRYGERVLAKPNKRGFNLILWFLPFVSVTLAAIMIYFLIRRWSAKVPSTPASHFDEHQLAEYEERLEKELNQFEKGL